jgi:hypothetical protein
MQGAFTWLCTKGTGREHGLLASHLNERDDAASDHQRRLTAHAAAQPGHQLRKQHTGTCLLLAV